jgi:hypothetical protein
MRAVTKDHGRRDVTGTVLPVTCPTRKLNLLQSWHMI